MKTYIYILFALYVFSSSASYAQEAPTADTAFAEVGVVIDTTGKLPNADTVFSTIRETAADTLPPKKLPFQPNAKKAGMYSSILPGLGQAYNRQYWKVPVVYAILGTAGYFINYNYQRYSRYRQAYINAIDGDPGTVVEDKYAILGGQQLQRLQNDAKKDLDVLVLLTSVGYALQIMDAVASAHLRNFDISRDISMQVKPVMQNNFIGVGLVMNFK